MKTETHPEYVECRVTCSCGNQFVTRATVPELRVELCAECHPFYTGKQKLVDTGGRVERFEKRYAKAKRRAAQREADGEASATTTKRKKRVSGSPSRKPPVATKGGPRPKMERRPRGERGGERSERRAKDAGDTKEAPADEAASEES